MEKKTPKSTYIILASALILGAAIICMILFFPDAIFADTAAQHTIQPEIPTPTEEPEADTTGGIPTVTPASQDALPDEDPSDTYTIENARFGIDGTGKDARTTTDGINTALKWAKSEGYKTVKFTEGAYLIQCNWQDRFIPPTDGILVPSDLTLDLGNSTFIIETNSYPEYAIFGIVNQSNVTIKNGTLIGDRDEHEYAPSPSSPTHEYGFGICISASSNVRIESVTIKNMTGDGIIIEGSYTDLADGGSVSSGIHILDCDISGCRRQGISVVGVQNCEIARNRIYDIAGTAPEYGILVMAQLDYVIDKLSIYENTIYNCAGGAIACNTGTNCDIYSNTCSGNILVVSASHVRIHDNKIQHSFIEVMPASSNVTVENNVLDDNSWIIISEPVSEP